MAPEFPSRDRGRRLYPVPIIIGLVLMVLSLLMVIYPQVLLTILAVLIALPLFLAGFGLIMIGLGLWHGMPDWREKIRSTSWHIWPRDDD